MKMGRYEASLWAEGVAAADDETKLIRGRDLAADYGFVPGPRGRDGGVDGAVGSARFFCRLKREPLGLGDAREFAAMLVRDRATVGACMAAIGYSPAFATEVRAVLFGAGRSTRLHLLTIADWAEQNDRDEALRRDVLREPGT